MNVEVLKILNNIGKSSVNELRGNLSSTRTNATLKTSNSIRYIVSEESTDIFLTIYGREFFKTVETGRRPTPQYTNPSKEFVQSIREWAAAKGVNTTFAYAIAKNIHKCGTKLFRRGGRKDIIQPVIESTIDKIAREVLEHYAKELLKDMKLVLTKK